MKNLKKILSCIMAIATLSSLNIIGVSAELQCDTIEKSFNNEDIVEVQHTDDASIIVLKDGRNYYLPKECDDIIFYNPDRDTLNSSEGYLVAYCVNIKRIKENDEYYIILPDNSKVGVSFHQSKAQAIYNLNNEYIGYRVDCEGETNSWEMFSATLENTNTIGDSENTIGDSVETVGGSDTGIRGDVNYDGKVNVSDLIYLRRYLLHLIKW